MDWQRPKLLNGTSSRKIFSWLGFFFSKIPKPPKKFLVKYRISRKVSDSRPFKTFPEYNLVVLSRPEFFLDFPEQQYQTYVVSSRSRLFGKWPPVSSQKKAQECRPLYVVFTCAKLCLFFEKYFVFSSNTFLVLFQESLFQFTLV